MNTLKNSGIRGFVAMAFVTSSLLLGFTAIAEPQPKRDVKPRTIADLSFTHAANKHMTDKQKTLLLNSYLSGHPVPVGKDICCCGGQVWNTDTQRCAHFGNHGQSVVVPK